LSSFWKRILQSLLMLFVLLAAAAIFVYRKPLWSADQQLRFQLWRSSVRSEYTNVGGYRVHYFEASPRTGEGGVPLVLIHGLGGRGEDWSPLAQAFAAAGFHVYVPDLLGYGRSSHPDVSYSISIQEKLVDLMQAVHVEHADVAGWSIGGWVAMKLAVNHAEMVNGLFCSTLPVPTSGLYGSAIRLRREGCCKRQPAVCDVDASPQAIPEFIAKNLVMCGPSSGAWPQ